jgi:nitroreductase
MSMNEVLRVIRERRSVRSYEPRPVPKEYLETLIDAATWAPSGMNVQPWRFVVVQDASLKNRLVAVAVPNSKRYLEPLRASNPARWTLMMKRYDVLADPVYYSAPVIIFIIGSGSQAADSCPMACLNLMLAAHSMGLGTCWVKLGSLVTDDPEIAGALELKEGETIFGPILVGYPGESPTAPARRPANVVWI